MHLNGFIKLFLLKGVSLMTDYFPNTWGKATIPTPKKGGTAVSIERFDGGFHKIPFTGSGSGKKERYDLNKADDAEGFYGTLIQKNITTGHTAVWEASMLSGLKYVTTTDKQGKKVQKAFNPNGKLVSEIKL
jgi:hypothetical protein